MAIMMSATFAFGQDNTSGTGTSGQDINNGNYQNATWLYVTAKVPGDAASKVKVSLTWRNDAGSIEPCYSPATQTQYGTWSAGTWIFQPFEAPTNCFLPNNGGARVTWFAVATNDYVSPPKVVNYGCGTFYIVPGSKANSLTIEGSDWNKCIGNYEDKPGGGDVTPY